MAPAAGVAILINEIRKIWRNPVLQEQKILANQSNTQGIYDRLYPWISRKANLELELKIQYNEEPNSRNSDEIQRIKDELSFIRRIERLERGIASLNGVERVREIGNFVDDMLYKIQSIRKSDLHDPSLITSMYGIVNRYLQEAITITQSAFLYTRFAQSLFEQNDNDELEAFRYSEKAIQLGPEYPKAYHQHIIICRALEIRPELRAKMRQIIIDCIHKLLKLKEPVEQELINDYL
jgi:hypothetical protein